MRLWDSSTGWWLLSQQPMDLIRMEQQYSSNWINVTCQNPRSVTWGLQSVLGYSHKTWGMVLRISMKFYIQNFTSLIISQWWGSQQKKKLLITDKETTDVIREALRYQQGAKSSYAASHFRNSFGTKNLAKASGCSKTWKHGRADSHVCLVIFWAVLCFSM